MKIRCSATCHTFSMDRDFVCMLEGGHEGRCVFYSPTDFVVEQIQAQFRSGVFNRPNYVDISKEMLRMWLFGTSDPLAVQFMLRLNNCRDWREFGHGIQMFHFREGAAVGKMRFVAGENFMLVHAGMGLYFDWSIGQQ